MSRRISLFVILILSAGTSLVAEDRCSKETLHKAAEQVLAVQTRLLAVKGYLSSTTKADIHALKAEIGSAVEANMRCESEPRGTGAIVAKGISDRLDYLLQVHRQKPRKTYEWDRVPEELDGIYASELAVKVKTLLMRPFTVGVQASFDIDCGDDNVLLVYEWKERRWQRALLWQAPDYDDIDGAFGDFYQYRLIPDNGKQGWALAVAHGHPWCTSNFSGFDVDVLEPQLDGNLPRVLFHTKEFYRRFDLHPRMKKTSDGFELRMSVESIDPEVAARRGIFRYRVTEGEVDRVQPIAMNGRDFVDSWLEIPWDEAAKWSAPNQLADLRSRYQKIQSSQNAMDGTLLNYGPVLKCSDREDHFQVALTAEKVASNGATTPLPSTYFQIHQGANSFTMLSASDKPDPHCSGGDLMGSR